MAKAQSGAMYFPPEFFTEEIEEREDRFKDCQLVQTDVDFGELLHAAVSAEFSRVTEDDDEDDLDGWELEDRDNLLRLDGLDISSSCPVSPSPSHRASSSDPFDGPLSPLPSSRASSPDPFGGPLSPLPSSRASSPDASDGSLSPLSPLSSRAPSPLPLADGSGIDACQDNVVAVGSSNSTGPSRKRKRKHKKKNAKAKARTKEHGNKRTKTDRQAERQKQSEDARHYEPSTHALKKLGEFATIETSFDATDLHSAKGGYIGRRLQVSEVHPDLEAHLKAGKKLVKWDGCSPHAIADKQARVFGLLSGHPNDPTWMGTIQRCTEAFRNAKEKIKFPKRQDRRGDFQTIAFGVSYGGGQKKPGNLRHSAHNLKIIDELRQNPDVQRMANYARSVYATYFPDLYNEYADVLGELFDGDPLLRHNFKGGVWPAVSINFPPNAWTKSHTDGGNKANGLCPIFALGDYDPTKGGHLVLEDLNLVIEFPPGSLILIPSATLRHGNIPVGPEETRTSWTQYAAGGLFRWMQYGRRSWQKLKTQDEARAAREAASRDARWGKAVAMFPTVDSLRARASKL